MLIGVSDPRGAAGDALRQTLNRRAVATAVILIAEQQNIRIENYAAPGAVFAFIPARHRLLAALALEDGTHRQRTRLEILPKIVWRSSVRI